MTFAPDAARGLRHVFVRGLTVQARLGVYAHEELRPQRVVIGIDLAVRDEAAPGAEGVDELSRVVDYGLVAATARRIASAGHVRLAETLAERIALALLGDDRITAVRVSVEKPDVLPDVTSVGVVVERTRF
ncbi:dihydroneopterin aldolase [Neoroseomonas eburnea]|nr:dihydroneopterin aldolase [Neoroseomonas eburnea]